MFIIYRTPWAAGSFTFMPNIATSANFGILASHQLAVFLMPVWCLVAMPASFLPTSPHSYELALASIHH